MHLGTSKQLTTRHITKQTEHILQSHIQLTLRDRKTRMITDVFDNITSSSHLLQIITFILLLIL